MNKEMNIHLAKALNRPSTKNHRIAHPSGLCQGEIKQECCRSAWSTDCMEYSPPSRFLAKTKCILEGLVPVFYYLGYFCVGCNFCILLKLHGMAIVGCTRKHSFILISIISGRTTFVNCFNNCCLASQFVKIAVLPP